MNARRWGGMLFLVMALLLLGHSQSRKNAELRVRSPGDQVWGGDFNMCVGTRNDCPDPKYSACVADGGGECRLCIYNLKGYTACVSSTFDYQICSSGQGTGTEPWCGDISKGKLDKTGMCNTCPTPAGVGCGIQIIPPKAGGSPCKTGPGP